MPAWRRPPQRFLSRHGRGPQPADRHERRVYQGFGTHGRIPAQGGNMGRTRTFGRQRGRQERHGTARGFFIVAVRRRVERYFSGMETARAGGAQFFGRRIMVMTGMIARYAAGVFARMLGVRAVAHQRERPHAARRQQIDDEQQRRYVSSEAHCTAAGSPAPVPSNGPTDCKSMKNNGNLQFPGRKSSRRNPNCEL